MYKGMPILPAGDVLFGKTKVAMKDIPREWKSGSILVFSKPNRQLHFVAGSLGDYAKIGSSMQCYHDQTGAQFAGPWVVVNEVSYETKDDAVTWTSKVPFDSSLNTETKAALAVFK